MMKNELVSVIIPAYNAEKYIKDSVRSVLNQTYNNVEVIVVNDGSTDATKTIIEAEFLNNTNVILINTLNNGVSAARNIGLSRAGGGYVLFLDADDELTQNAVNVLVKTLEENRADIVSSCFVGEGDSVKDIKILCGKEALKASILDYPETYSACAKIYKKDILTDVSFSEGIRVHEDSFFLFNIFLKQPKMTVINEETYLYKNNAGSASRSGFSDKYLDILWVADQKIKKIQEFYPELYDIANNITVKANMALLFNLCNVKGKKDLSKNCIKAIKTNKKYFVAATKSDRKRFFIVKNNLFWLYKLYRNIKGKLFG